jgi:hypothetical protein
LKECNVDIDEAQPRDQALKRRFVPKSLDIGADSLEVIECPGILPRENDQKETQFEGEDGETDGQQVPWPALGRGCRRLERDVILRKRAAWG